MIPTEVALIAELLAEEYFGDFDEYVSIAYIIYNKLKAEDYL